jgi:hypothetical protein
MGADRLTASVHELYKMAALAAPIAEGVAGAGAGSKVAGALTAEELADMGPNFGQDDEEGEEGNGSQPQQQQQQDGNILQGIANTAAPAGRGVGNPAQNYG